jgi:hypothetical protein
VNTPNRDDSPPVLSLDIDDVLCLNERFGGFDAIETLAGKHPHPAEVYRELFAAGARDVLHRIHEAMAGRLRYVISSTWRQSFDREQMRDLFRNGGLGFVAGALHAPDRWCTPDNQGLGRRVDEIAGRFQIRTATPAFIELNWVVDESLPA